MDHVGTAALGCPPRAARPCWGRPALISAWSFTNEAAPRFAVFGAWAPRTMAAGTRLRSASVFADLRGHSGEERISNRGPWFLPSAQNAEEWGSLSRVNQRRASLLSSANAESSGVAERCGYNDSDATVRDSLRLNYRYGKVCGRRRFCTARKLLFDRAGAGAQRNCSSCAANRQRAFPSG